MLASRLLGWSFVSPPADRLLIVPQDLRTADPSFWDEIEHGQFGLAGTIAFLRGRSPFDIEPPNAAWAAELHGFGWLRNLAAVPEEEARQAARRLAAEWAIRFGAGTGVAARPEVAGRRLIAWISHGGLLLEGADAETYEIITSSLGRQLGVLSSTWREATDGYPRLLALIALMLADLAVAGNGRQLKDVEAALSNELARQILPDGAHISRNPTVLVELMLDLLPLSKCFAARGRKHPAQLVQSMAAIMHMLRYLRLGDGMLARFNGMGVPSAAALGTVLAYDDGSESSLSEARDSGYARLERGASIIVVDVGTPPPQIAAGEAQAGCLSFEMSAGKRLIFVNGGMPGAACAEWLPAARATASHNTLCLAEKSSSGLVAHSRLETLVGATPIRHPDHVEWKLEKVDGGIALEASHDGYHHRFGLIHRRRMLLSSDGNRLEGRDHLEGLRRKAQLRTELPFAIHFHLHPDVRCRVAAHGEALLTLSDGQCWRLTAQGAALAVEEGTFFASSTGPTRALQVVLRAATLGESEVDWVVERLEARPT